MASPVITSDTIIKRLTVFSRVGSIISGQCLPTCLLRGLASLPLRSGLQPGRILTGGAYIRVTLGRDSIPFLIAYRDAAAAKAPDEKEKAALPAGPFKVPDTANAA